MPAASPITDTSCSAPPGRLRLPNRARPACPRAGRPPAPRGRPRRVAARAAWPPAPRDRPRRATGSPRGRLGLRVGGRRDSLGSRTGWPRDRLAFGSVGRVTCSALGSVGRMIGSALELAGRAIGSCRRTVRADGAGGRRSAPPMGDRRSRAAAVDIPLGSDDPSIMDLVPWSTGPGATIPMIDGGGGRVCTDGLVM